MSEAVDEMRGASPAWLRWCSAAVLLLVAFAFSFTPLRSSHDEWWHLKTGKFLAEHGLPKYEVFTYTADKIEWHNHEWLTQLAMWRVYQAGDALGLGGVRAVIALKTVFIVLAFVGFAVCVARELRRRGLDPLWGLLAGALCVALARRTFYPRPPFVTYLLMAIVLGMLMAVRSGLLRARWLWGLAPLFALWANLHGGWMAGLLIVGAFWGEAVVTLCLARVRGDSGRDAMRGVLRLNGLGAACVAATLVNPYGYQLYALAGRVFSDAYLLSSIGEMMPPDWHFVWVLEGVILLYAACALRPVRARGWLATAVILVMLHFALRHAPGAKWQVALALPWAMVAIVRTKQPAALAHAMLVAFFMQQGLMHVRHLSLLGVIALPSLAWVLSAWAEAWSEGAKGVRERVPWMVGGGALGVLAIVWLFVPLREPAAWPRAMQLLSGQELATSVVAFNPERMPVASELPRGVYEVEGYPVRAADFMLRADLPGPIFNGGNYAGYLIWRFAPERYKVFTDNRYDIYGGLVIREEHSVLNGWDHVMIAELKRRGVPLGDYDLAWNEVLDKWQVQTAFLPADVGGNARLAGAGWQRVYEDIGFNLWVRNTPENATVIARARTLPRPLPRLLARPGR